MYIIASSWILVQKGLLTNVVCVRFQLLCPQVSSELLPSHVQGAYLRFPSATDLTTDYNGEYTCTVTSNRLPTRKLSAIFVVLEPGEWYTTNNKQQKQLLASQPLPLTIFVYSILLHAYIHIHTCIPQIWWLTLLCQITKTIPATIVSLPMYVVT